MNLRHHHSKEPKADDYSVTEHGMSVEGSDNPSNNIFLFLLSLILDHLIGVAVAAIVVIIILSLL